MSKQPRKTIPEVPKTVFEKFLGELGKDAAAADVVARLRAVLLEDGDLTDAAIKAALLPNDDDKAS
jgi:hypothetical protein